MIKVIGEGEKLINGINLYPLSSESSFGFKIKIKTKTFAHFFIARYGKKTKMFTFRHYKADLSINPETGFKY